jgi:hypothetical protein
VKVFTLSFQVAYILRFTLCCVNYFYWVCVNYNEMHCSLFFKILVGKKKRILHFKLFINDCEFVKRQSKTKMKAKWQEILKLLMQFATMLEVVTWPQCHHFNLQKLFVKGNNIKVYFTLSKVNLVAKIVCEREQHKSLFHIIKSQPCCKICLWKGTT